MSAPGQAQLAAAVADLDAEIAARLVARRRLLELARQLAGHSPAPPPFYWDSVNRANARQIRRDLIQ